MGKKRKSGEEVDGGGASKESSEKTPSAKRKKANPEEKERGKTKVESSGAAAKNKTDWTSIEWEQLGETKDGRPWNLKLSSWNVNGIRAWLKNGGLEYVKQENPDIFCVQETKCAEKELPMEQLNIPGYKSYWHSAQQKGYSGVGLYSKEEPVAVIKGIGMDKYDCEGRLLVAEYKDFYFLTSYVPNAGEGLKRLAFKKDWDKDFREYLVKLDKVKPVILCGDLNVAHQEIDLKNPKTNHGNAGFTPEERGDFSLLLQEGFVDVFRSLYPERQHAYTYWSYRFNGRAKDTGWRLDYFVVSERLLKDVTDCVIRKGVFGSDHCPLVLGLSTTGESAVGDARKQVSENESAEEGADEGTSENRGSGEGDRNQVASRNIVTGEAGAADKDTSGNGSGESERSEVAGN